MKILIDTNLILDFLLERQPFFKDAEALFQLIKINQITGYVTATTLTDIFYITKRHTKSLEKANQAVSVILDALQISPVNRQVLELALCSSTPDFEDAVQAACAITQGLDALVTRDADFVTELVPLLSVSEFLKQVAENE
ncbi:PIN domain-containing protein [Leptolyngbya cf. ectocarpi LEGE 11479]|uniref:PIN domain-containing protein n=1 Tax=Leptolyngbya cf. ectocarpi LEGE 11479 TaxID=1828722 RepID=A0A928WZR0_LEPEC|nr:PIN domain-containing protein [Leptolyngbya cf. ectocarpi LEGE 11479]